MYLILSTLIAVYEKSVVYWWSFAPSNVKWADALKWCKEMWIVKMICAFFTTLCWACQWLLSLHYNHTSHLIPGIRRSSLPELVLYSLFQRQCWMRPQMSYRSVPQSRFAGFGWWSKKRKELWLGKRISWLLSKACLPVLVCYASMKAIPAAP